MVVGMGIPSFKVFQFVYMQATTCEDRLTITLVSGDEEIVNRAYFFLALT